MCGQAFTLGEGLDLAVHLFQCLPGIRDNTGLLDEVVHVYRGEEPCGTVGGQNVVRTCKLITQGFGSILSQENRTGIADTGHGIKRILCNDLQMLGSNGVGGINSIFHVVG